MISYYYKLLSENVKKDKEDRTERVRSSENTMCKRHVIITSMNEPHILYKSMHNDIDRIIITRWRLSSHPLFIETGRYKKPKIIDIERKCVLCNVVEDEEHAIFQCSAHSRVRYKFREIIDKYNSVPNILNPINVEDMKIIASFLRAIEKNMEDFKLIQ